METWKKIKGYEDCYEVSDLGRVKSLKNNKSIILKGNLDSKGYLTVSLSKNDVSKTHIIHQLVAIAFLNHIPNRFKLVVNHINFNRLDNRLDNLEVVTHRENTNQKHIKSKSKYVGVQFLKSRNKWIARIYLNGKSKQLGSFYNELDASNCYQDALNRI